MKKKQHMHFKNKCLFFQALITTMVLGYLRTPAFLFLLWGRVARVTLAAHQVACVADVFKKRTTLFCAIKSKVTIRNSRLFQFGFG